MNLTGVLVENRFEIRELIAEGGMGYLYRGIDTRNGADIAVKTLKPSAVSNRIEDLIRFKGVMGKLSGIDNDNIARIIGCGNLTQAYEAPLHYIVMELVRGESLHDLLKSGRSFTPEEASGIILQAGRALEAVHGIGVIHGDVKPGNIIINEGIGGIHVKLIDFGLSRIKKPAEPEYSGEACGTFCYMPPEQAGILRRDIDERSDLYSLGVAFYELLSGTLPFSGDSLVMLLHEQAAKLPDPPSVRRPGVPKVLDAVTVKLLAKEPEGRYQGAAGLIADLERYLAGDRDFRPGSSDTAARLDFNAPLAGRDAELDRLMSLLEKARGGHGGLCLLTGEAGIGKTRLADEFRKRVMSLGIPYIEGRAFNRENRTPHGPVHDAFTDYMRNFRRYGRERRQGIIAVLKKECGDLGRIITRFNPQADELLGDCPEIVPLEPEREIQRFYATLCRFIVSLAKAEGCLVAMVDDLHWSDQGTIKLMEEVLRYVHEAPLLLLGAFRSDEIGDGHPIRIIMRGNTMIEEIRVGHLNREGVASMIRSTLTVEGDGLDTLVRFVSRTGGGNPLFSIEIIKQLIHEKLISRVGEKWVISAQRLEDAKIPETIINTLLKRTDILADEDKNLLSRAAVAGNTFDLDLLVRLEPAPGEIGAIREARMRAVIDAVDRAVELQLLAHTQQETGTISFAHDRIRDAFYGRISAEERKRLHRLIGTALEQERRAGTGEIIFDLAYHWIQAGDEDKILEYTARAEARARENYSYKDAIEYLRIIRTILKNRLAQRRNEEDSRRLFHYSMVLAETNLDIFEARETLELLNSTQPLLRGKEDQAAFYLLLTRAYFINGDNENCEEMAARGLSVLGEKIPRSRTGTVVGIVMALASHFVYSMIRWTQGQSEHPVRGTMAEILKYFDWLWFAYAFTDDRKFGWLALRRLALVERRIGASRELALCRVNYALVMTLALPRLQKWIIKSLPGETGEIPDERRIFSYYYTVGFIHFVNCEYPEAISAINKGFALSEKTGDTWGLYWAGFIVFAAYQLRSRYDEAGVAFTSSLRHVKNIIEDLTIGSWCYPSEYYIETGQMDKALDWFGSHLTRLRDMKMWSQYSFMNIDYACYHLDSGETAQALARLDEARATMRRFHLPPYWLTSFYPRYAQALIADFIQRQDSFTRRQRRSSLRSVKKACRIAIRKTRRDRFITMVSFRMFAHYHALKNNDAQARRWFGRSIEIAITADRRYEEARSRYEFGVYLKDSGDRRAAWEQLVTASMIFDEIGVTVYRERIAGHLGLGSGEGAGMESRLSREKTLYMIDKSREFASCSGLGELLGRVLALAMEISGARNGHMFLYDNDAGKLDHAVSRSVDETSWSDFSWNVVRDVFGTGRAVVAADAAADADLSSYRSISHLSLKSLLCAPMEFNGAVRGVCYLDNPLAGGVFGDEEFRLVTLLLANASIAVENALLHRRIEHDKTPSPQMNTALLDENLCRVIAYLEEHFSEDVTRGDLAEIIGVHPDYLGKLFKVRTGRTIREYANDLKIRAVMERLENTDDKIITIAFDAGFESLRTFNRIFSRAAGMTPAEYRERNRKA